MDRRRFIGGTIASLLSGGTVLARPQRERPRRRPVVQRYPLAPQPELRPMGFPRLFSYAGNNGAGAPFMPSAGTFDAAYITALSRYHVVTPNTVPWTNPANPDYLQLFTLIKAQNPRTKIYLYDAFQWRFLHVSPTMYGDEHTLAGPKVFFQWNGKTFPFSGTYPFNGDAGYFWDTAASGKMDALLAIWQSYAVGKADGLFLDTFEGKVTAWANFFGVPPNDPTYGLDYVTAGYASLAALDTACLNATDYFITQLAPRDTCIINRGGTVQTPNATGHKAHGELFEGWDPDQGFATGTTPPLNYVFAGGFDTAMTEALYWQGPTPTSDGAALIMSTDKDPVGGGGGSTMAEWTKMIRYTLASACVVGGCGGIGNSRKGADALKWADEYSVLPDGSVDGTKKATGWLGRPVEYGYKDTGGCYVRHFENGVAAVNGNSTSKTIDLGRVYRRITGSQAPTINNGTTEQVATLGMKDGRLWVNV